MPESIYKTNKTEEVKDKARKLYREGLTTREIAPLVKKSHTWVWQAVRDMEAEDRQKLSTDCA